MAKRRSLLTGSPNRPPPRRRYPGLADRPPPPSGNGLPPRASNPNLLLAALPDRDYARLSPALDRVSLRLKEFLQKPGETLHYVYFPGDGFCSEVTVLEDGTMVEAAVVGREGLVGLLTGANGGPIGSSATMVQGPMTTCYRMTAAAFRDEMERREAFYAVVSGYSQVLTKLVMQSTACNAVHNVEQRLARWLLTAHDHMRNDSFPLTQEFVAMMLGVARPTVAVVAGKLQKAGLIKYHHGELTIVDREQLENAACECYRTAANLLATIDQANTPTLARAARRGIVEI
jgi:CRP-like cAMP-binding protein